MKARRIEQYQKMITDQEKTQQAISLLKDSIQDESVFRNLTKDFSQLKSLIEELDISASDHGTLNKMESISEILNSRIR